MTVKMKSEAGRRQRQQRVTDRILALLLVLVIALNAAIAFESAHYYSSRTCHAVNVFKRLQNDSNVTTHQFLVVAAIRAKQAAKVDKGAKRQLDLKGARVYSALAASYHRLIPSAC